MFKLLGFLLGSAASILAVVMLIGMPEFHLSKLADANGRFDAAVEQLREKQTVVDTIGVNAFDPDTVDPAPDEPLPEESNPEVTTIEQSLEENFFAAEGAPDHGLPPASDGELTASEGPYLPAETLPLLDIASEASWYAFWNPFRSEIAARGFVAQLEKVTGLDYRIVKVKAGVYQVAFAYADDQQRQARLSQIQAATGLDLSGTRR